MTSGRLVFGGLQAPNDGRLVFGDDLPLEPAQVQVRVLVAGAWLPAIIKRRTGGAWVTAAVRVRVGGSWAPT